MKKNTQENSNQPSKESQLNKLNQDFYSAIADSFSDSRSVSWSDGWDKLTSHLIPAKSVLDIGCGNGRFWQYLVENGYELSYKGVDSSSELIKIAEENNPKVSFEVVDILADDFKVEQGVDFVTMYGVMHHMPTSKSRESLLTKISDGLDSEGVFVFTTWLFTDNPRLMKRSSKLSDFELSGLDKTGFDISDCDYILDWKIGDESYYRYAYDYIDQEVREMIESAGLEYVQSFVADKYNKYWVCKKK